MSESTHNQNRQSRARTTRAIQRIHQIPQIFNLQNIALVLTILLILPLIAVISRGILENTSGWQHLAQTVLPKWSLNTLALCSMVAPGVLLLGLPPAWIVSRYNFKTRKILEVALVLPLAVPAYISAMALGWLLDGAGPLQSALRTLFNANGALLPPIRSIGGAALILSLALYPYVYLLARKAFLLEGGEAFEIARSLGAKPLRAFTRIALPLARPALVAGIALALMETLAEYGALQLLGVNTWTTAVFRAWLSMGDPALAARLASFLLLAVALVLLAERSLRKGRNFAFARAKPKQTTRPQLNPKYTSIA
ncbi:MAG: ABC transporter permease subunit, partial [Alphaproteobacteria bacterium]